MKHYLYLILQLGRREVLSRYRGTVMGIFWSFISPVVMLVVYTFVFSEVFKARWGVGGTDKTAFAVNLFAGIIVHGFFAECLSRSPTLMPQYVSYVKRVVFPLAILPPVVVVSALFHTFISVLVLLIAHFVLYGFVHWQALFLPLLMLPLVFVALGCTWLLTALGVFLRDIGQIMPVVITILMFMAPVFYPVSALPEAYQGWLYLNPLTPAIESARALLLQGELPGWQGYFLYLAAGLASAALGWAFFERARKGFADVL